jgi:tetratricopeptide (TPR) repeat protein
VGLLRATHPLAEAEPLYRRALEIDEKSFGLDHPNVAEDLNNLASLLCATNRRVRRSRFTAGPLRSMKRASARIIPRCQFASNNLAALYYNQGQYAKAEPLYNRALAIWEKTLGPEHPNVKGCLEDYALVLRKMGRSEEATRLERMFEKSCQSQVHRVVQASCQLSGS